MINSHIEALFPNHSADRQISKVMPQRKSKVQKNKHKRLFQALSSKHSDQTVTLKPKQAITTFTDLYDS